MNPDDMTFELTIRLTLAEVAAIKKAREHVRVHMAHEHSWDVRDAAMTGLGKVVGAAKKADLL